MAARQCLLIASSVEVFCPYCGEGQPAKDGSLIWTSEDLERAHGRRQCCSCDRDIKIVSSSARVQ